MKKEILRLESVSQPPYLDEVTLHICEGEIVGIIPINNLGINELVSVITSNTPIHYGHVFFEGICVDDYLGQASKENKVMVIAKEGTLINSLNIEDNLFVLRKGTRHYVVRKKLLNDQSRRLLEDIGLQLNPKTLVGELPYFTQVALEFAKALVTGTKLVIVRDLSSFVQASYLEQLHQMIRKLKQRGISFLYICNHHQESFLICDRCYLQKEGHMIKCLEPFEMTDEVMAHYDTVFSDKVESSERQSLFAQYRPTTHRVFQTNNLCFHSLRNLTMTIQEGETVVILGDDDSLVDDFFLVLEGVFKLDASIVSLDETSLTPRDRRISLVGKNPLKNALFYELSVIDNICFCADHKLKNLWRIPRLRRSIATQLAQELGPWIYNKDLYELSTSQFYEVLFQRILLQNPRLAVFVQPFSTLDMYQRIRTIEYFDMFRKKGIAVCILAVSLSDSLQIADRLLVIENGQISKVYQRSEFSTYRGIAGSKPK
ncbi:MAG: hypothetical protein WCR02_08800 [Sphaerochaetaceae bacterium]